MADTPQHEPTMEEILASIRKIISEDSNAKPAVEAESPAPAPVEEPALIEDPAPAAEPDEPMTDVLELTEVVEESPATASEPKIPEDDIDFATVQEDEPAPAAATGTTALEEAPKDPEETAPFAIHDEEVENPVPLTEPSDAEHTETDESLFSDKSREALDDAISGIDQAIEETPPKEPGAPIPPGGEQELGAIILGAVRAKIDPTVTKWLDDNCEALVVHLKPIIREWLDENFPALLADAVRDEVSRAVKLRGIKH